MDSAIIGLLGALVGALSSIGGIWIQSYFQMRRERLTQAMTWAAEQRKEDLKNAPDGSAIMPISVYLQYQLELTDMFERRQMNKERLLDLSHRIADMCEAMEQLEKKRGAQPARR